MGSPMHRAVALFSGGLDSTLAVRIVQQQGFVVDALYVRTTYACCKVPAARAAAALDIDLTVLPVGDDYLDLIRRPAHGYGRGLNPCVDCRIYMAKLARRMMLQRDACMVVSGEILGQRPNSQKRVALSLVAKESGLDGRLLRPLSARLLAPTLPESQGLIDRQRLYAFSGRSRKGLIQLARQLGIRAIPGTSSGCPLAVDSFAPRVGDLLRHQARATAWDFELLKIGRHLRIDARAKLVLGRNAAENAALREFVARPDAPECALLIPETFRGPDALWVGPAEPEAMALAGALILRYTRRGAAGTAQVRVMQGGASRLMRVLADERAGALRPL